VQQSYVIDIDGAFVGAAVRLEDSYRFIATDTRVDALHGSLWPTLEELQRRVHRRYRATTPTSWPARARPFPFSSSPK
jgi:hypothetical protein